MYYYHVQPPDTLKYQSVYFFCNLKLVNFPIERMIEMMFSIEGWGDFMMVGNNGFKNSPEGVGAAADGRSVDYPAPDRQLKTLTWTHTH